MASTFPTTLDALTNPAGSDPLLSIHSALHGNANDAIEAIEAAIGVTGSAVAGTVHYRLDALEDAPVGVTDHGALIGLADDDHAQYHNDARGDARYALLASGVTNGNTHDHNGGDGGTIAYSSLSGLPTLGGAAALNVGATAGTVAAGDDARIVASTPAETAATIGALIAGATAKAVPVGADALFLSDSAASGVGKKTTITDLLEAIYKAGVPRTVMNVGTPFCIPAGDGSSNGLQFTGTAGAYTLSAAIITDGWYFLRGGFWLYLTSGFGGSAYPAGWYWSVMSSDTAGVVYTETYTTGVTTGPAAPTAFPVNLTGWLTSTTSEVVGPTGFTLPGGSLGKNGVLTSLWKLLGNASSTKSFFQLVGGSKTFQMNISTLPSTEIMATTRNAGTESQQANSRSPITSTGGVGGGASSSIAYAPFESTLIDTSINASLVVSLKLGAVTSCAILLGYTATAHYGA
ncbi:MAG: hypothetical protein KAY59_05100 [Acidobacteria bacterium]|nr:hypothetical protein [Acidobacteriota bacterium]